MIRSLIDALKGLLPNANLPTKVWLIRLIAVFVLSSIVYLGLLQTLGSTRLGIKYGFSPVPSLSHRQFQAIQREVYAELSRMRQASPEIEVGFVLANYNAQGNFVASEDGTLGIFSAYTPESDFVGFSTLEQTVFIAQRGLFEQVFKARSCIEGDISGLSKVRVKQGLSNFKSDRYVICPIFEKNGNAFAATAVGWRTDPKLDGKSRDAKVKEVVKTVKDLTLAIEDFLKAQPGLLIGSQLGEPSLGTNAQMR